ncbi:hypothetical protein N7G274_002279 [Stereocaulon virgatum]|uniref:RRM domain-containing protein n=1 Tax=Stereocaulon virgatum TaxID=373712 RepID=A0ABR4AKM7_9LECA
MGRHSTAIVAAVPKPPISSSRKRKRDQNPATEIEIDVSAPEPPSKKALRRAKKGKAIPAAANADRKRTNTAAMSTDSASDEDIGPAIAAPIRSDYGIWIGNLPWTATKLELRNFLTKDTDISDDMITRLHMPPPSKSAIAASRQRLKPQNQGFAYVDFSTEAALSEALVLSEKLLIGRRVLIKDSKNFEGRPEKSKDEGTATSAGNTGNPPSKRIFVGNLGFDTTREMLQEHFQRCGEVLDAFVATFEDTGKCKGYGWVEFAELEAGEAAVRGWINSEEKENIKDEDDEIAEALADQEKLKKKSRPRKWWVNRLGGRPLRMEFAEGKDVRYKKRYGKEGTARKEDVETGDVGTDANPISIAQPLNRHVNKKAEKAQSRIDARKIKPGAALAAAPRAMGNIVESKGKKTTFT